jgi:HSP20 family molecular chaperone IbpA
MLVRTTPYRLRVRPWAFDRSFDELVDSFFRPVHTTPSTPVVTSAWDEGSLRLTVDLPGIPREAVDVSVTTRTLTVSVTTDNLKWRRSLTLGAGLDPEQVAAEYSDGRLTVVVAPVAEAEPRRIEIGTATVPAIETGDQPEGDSGDQDTSATA